MPQVSEDIPYCQHKNGEFNMPKECHSPQSAYLQHSGEPSRNLLRIKVTPDLHLTYSKNGGNLGLVLKMKNIACI